MTSRQYRQTRRAAQQDETRLRITEATVDLHGTVGPARTTISAVAERAGVQRATVYRHFPTEEALFAACSSHWRAANPRPDPTTWTTIEDRQERTLRALTELYAYYARTEQMLSNLIRDEDRVDVLRPLLGAFWGYLDEVVRSLAPPRAGKRVRAALRHALDFRTWQSLTRDNGLTNREAAELMAKLAEAA
jgi:AcrR family transcriptional regulator